MTEISHLGLFVLTFVVPLLAMSAGAIAGYNMAKEAYFTRGYDKGWKDGFQDRGRAT